MLRVFRGIPVKHALFDFVFIGLFSTFNCMWSVIVANAISDIPMYLSSDASGFVKLIINMLSYLVLWEVIEFICDVHNNMATAYIGNDVGKYYFNKLYLTKPSILKEQSTGYISGVLEKLVTNQTNAYLSITCDMSVCIVYILFYTIKIGTYNAGAGLLLTILFLTTNLSRIIWQKKFEKPYIDAMINAWGEKNKLLIDIVSNINTVQKMSAIRYMNDKINDARDNVYNHERKYQFANEVGFIMAKMPLYAYTPIALLWVYLSGNNDLLNNTSFLAIMAVVATQAPHNARGIYRAMREYGKFKSSADKLDSIVSTDNVRRESTCSEIKSIDMLHIDYSYVDSNTYNKVSIEIPEFHVDRGDTVCIYGESGQGKTTLLNILSGEIETAGVYVNNVPEYHLHCVFVSQDTEMFDMSLRDNLSLGKDIQDSTLITYLNRTGLGDWFSKQEEGLDTMLGERGVFVSTGQRQRLNLIRGLLMTDKEVYLLDEPTSNVDTKTEELIVDLIKEKLCNKTVIIVTHRPKIMNICNKFYVFENGMLREDANR